MNFTKLAKTTNSLFDLIYRQINLGVFMGRPRHAQAHPKFK